MKIYAADKSELMQVTKVERDGDNLVLKGKVFGTMPMAATLTPEEARNFRKLLTPKLLWFLLTLPFRLAFGLLFGVLLLPFALLFLPFLLLRVVLKSLVLLVALPFVLLAVGAAIVVALIAVKVADTCNLPVEANAVVGVGNVIRKAAGISSEPVGDSTIIVAPQDVVATIAIEIA